MNNNQNQLRKDMLLFLAQQATTHNNKTNTEPYKGLSKKKGNKIMNTLNTITAIRIYKDGSRYASVGFKSAFEILRDEKDVKCVIIGNRDDKLILDRDQIDWKKSIK